MRGESPEAHVFHSALCLERAPRRLSPWKQNRGGGGRQSEAELGPEWGEGRWGLMGCCLGNGTEAPLRFVGVMDRQPVPPDVPSLAPFP